MCLILFAFQSHPRYKLIFAANRDEFYHRPTAPARWWEEAAFLLAGKDLEAGGTWMGITKKGKIAALTNYRGPEPRQENAPSRGTLVSQYLLAKVSGGQYLEELRLKGTRYNGFNLIVGDMDGLYYYSNMKEGIIQVKPGIYGLSNASLDTPWPKVSKGKQMLEHHVLNQSDVSPETVFSILENTEIAPDVQLPDTGIGTRYERILSPIFIKSPEYGTRSSTVLLVDNENHVTFAERGFVPPSEKKYQFTIHAPSSVGNSMTASTP